MLEQYRSLCGITQKIIVSKDAGTTRTHTALNVDKNVVRHYQIDGVIIAGRNGKKCDFLLINDTKKEAYLIELKGTDLGSALKQLENTESILSSDLDGFVKKYRIVYRANTHAIQSNEYKKFCLKRKGLVLAKTARLEEAI